MQRELLKFKQVTSTQDVLRRLIKIKKKLLSLPIARQKEGAGIKGNGFHRQVDYIFLC